MSTRIRNESGGPSQNFADALARHALTRPHATALVMGERRRLFGGPAWERVDFASLNERADAIAAHLVESGVAPGDRVLFLVRPSLDYFVALLATMRAGAAPVLIDFKSGLAHVAACIAQIRPRAALAPLGSLLRPLGGRALASVEIFISPKRVRRAGAASSARPPDDRAARAPTTFAPTACDAGHEALVIFTSRATGPTRAVSMTHGMLAAQTETFRHEYGWQPGQTMVHCFAPFVLHTLAGGLTSVIPAIDLTKPASTRGEDVIDAANAHRADFVFAASAVWTNVVREAERTPLRFEVTRRIIMGGGPVDVDLQRRVLQLMPNGSKVLVPYAVTEALPIATIDSSEVLAETARLSRQGSGTCLGRPLRGVEVRVIGLTDAPIDRWHDDLELPPGQLGEIVVGGAIVSTEYKDFPEANVLSKIRRGHEILHRTGDVGYKDRSGRLWFGGKKSDLLRTPAGMIAPLRVENVLRHAKVFRTALVGLGEAPRQRGILCVEMEPGEHLTPEIVAELRKQLGRAGLEDAVAAILEHPGMPVDSRHNSLIRRSELRDWVKKHRARAMWLNPQPDHAPSPPG